MQLVVPHHKIMRKKINLLKGFTLVEMAIVLVIIGLVITGLLGPLGAQIEQKQNEETRVVLEEAKEALMGYAVANKYLPCPDTSLVPNGTEGNRVANKCAVLEGVLPWQALGVRGLDAWGRYIRYRVSAEFSNNASFFGISTAGDIQVKSDTGILTNSAVAILISHGPNGFGGKNVTQSSPENQMPLPTGVDELENADGANLVFISHTPTPKGSLNEFDDSVSWLSSNILINRMVAAGQLP